MSLCVKNIPTFSNDVDNMAFQQVLSEYQKEQKCKKNNCTGSLPDDMVKEIEKGLPSEIIPSDMKKFINSMGLCNGGGGSSPGTNGKKLNGGVIAGIVIGSVAALIIIILLIVMLTKKKKK